jgi:hypothetical protein
MRTIVNRGNRHIILDKSLHYKFPNSGAAFNAVQGEIKSSLILKPHPHQPDRCLMIVTNITDYKGYLKGFLNRKASFNSLKEYKNLAEFLNQRAFFDPLLIPIVRKSSKAGGSKRVSFKGHYYDESEHVVSPSIGKEGVYPEIKNTKEYADAFYSEPARPQQDEIELEERKNDAVETAPQSDLVSKIRDWSTLNEEVPAESCIDREEEISAEEFLAILEENKHIHAAISTKHLLGISECDYRKETIDQSRIPFSLHSDFAKNKEGGLLYLNKKVMEDQKRVLSFMLKKMGTNLLTGKSIMSVSLPVDIFDEHSVLRRTAMSFAHAPSLLERAGVAFDPLEQFKLTIAFLVSTLYTTLSQRKPFNPILGETFQARINGCPVVLEQISHHPPISAFFMEGKNYFIKGNGE